MGLLDEVLKEVGGAGSSGAHESVVGELLGMLSKGGMPTGLGSLVDVFNRAGLGDVVSSWISTGKNLPISADQIQNVLGSEQVKELAAKAGIDPSRASEVIAQVLPQIVDRCTPDGRIPGGGILDSLSGLFRT